MDLIDGITDNKYYGTLQGTPYYLAPTSSYEAIGYLFDKDPNKFSLRSYSRDDTLGRRELERYFKDNNVNLDRNTIEAMLRVYNSKSGKYNYGTNNARNAQDLLLISNALYSAKLGTRRINPWTGEEYYAGDTNYNSGVATEAEALAIRAKYAPIQEKFAKHLLDLAYSAYSDRITSTKTPVQKFEGNDIWNGTTSIDKATAFKLIKEAGLDGTLRIKNSWGDNNLLNNIEYGSKSKEAMGRALELFKKTNASLYNALVGNKEFLKNYTSNPNNWEKLDYTISKEPLTKEDWFKTLDDTQKNDINSKVNNLTNLLEFERKLIPKSTTMSTAFDVNNMVGYRKNGGTMRKYQQGGQAPTAAQMVLLALSAAQQGDQSGLQLLFSDKKTAQAVIQLLQKEAQEGSEEAIQALEALKQIMGGSKKQATMALKGAKLSYIHRLATGCPPGMEMTYFKKGGRLCKACIEKAKKAKEEASLDNISEAPKRSKYGFGGFFEYFKCGGKPKKPKCGTKAKCGAELEKCGGKTPMDKCGGKTPMTKCGGKAPMDKCGGKTTLAKCGTELKKCGGKAKKSSPKKPIVNKDKCGGKAKKHAIGGNLELLKYMILNYNK